VGPFIPRSRWDEWCDAREIIFCVARRGGNTEAIMREGWRTGGRAKKEREGRDEAGAEGGGEGERKRPTTALLRYEIYRKLRRVEC